MSHSPSRSPRREASYPHVVVRLMPGVAQYAPVPPGLSADEILQRVDFFAREENFAAWIVWNEERTTYVTPRGAREDGPRHFVGGMWMNWGLDPLSPVPDADTLASRTLPPHKEARRWLTGSWHVAYPDGFRGWTPAEDSTLDLRADGTFVWESSLPWFISGRDWLVHASEGVVDLSLHSRYYWCDNHLVVRDHRADGRPAWTWRTREGRDILYAVK